jgi:putative transposase
VVSASRKVDAKDIEILVLRHQLEILTRKKGKPCFRSKDKVLLASLSRLLPRIAGAAFWCGPRPC